MKPLRARWLLVWACTFALVMTSLLLVGGGLYAVLAPEQHVAAVQLLAANADFLYFIVLSLFAVMAMLAAWLTKTYFTPIVRAAEQTRLISSSNPGARLDAAAGRELRGLVDAVNGLAEAFQRLREEDAKRIEEARADVERERQRLAALMSELTQGVVVCNAEGRILLYNEYARGLLTASSSPGAGSGAAGYMGIGRSLYALMHRESVEHALGQLRARIAAGTGDPVTTFATASAAGTMLRARIAPVAAAAAGATADAGYVLLLEDLSRELSALEHRDALLTALIEQSRAALGSARAATENLASQPDMPLAMRSRFLGIAQDELKRLTRLVEHTGAEHASGMTRRPDLEPMRLAELAEAVASNLRSIPGVEVTLEPIDSASWVQVDSFAVMQAVRYLVRRLREGCDRLAVALRATSAGEYVYFDLDWAGDEIAAATVLEWETAPIASGAEAGNPSVRELMARNRAEFWHEAQAGRACFRIMLRSVAAERSDRHLGQRGRPVYYDFDLFHQLAQNPELDDAPLSALSYTAFDTETTGLEPSGGDEIISIGAVRIVNGRMLQAETFDQLVDPQRPIDPEAAKVHGIRPSMLAGQPDIGAVLPAFHRFCEDTVLVGHNAGFDLRFLQLKEATTGVRFAQPVLDTLLLSALLYEALNDHRLEAIAQRMGVHVIARHTALGDAIVTAQVFLRMLPLLAAQGIVTLRQAREASSRTYYAKLRY